MKKKKKITGRTIMPTHDDELYEVAYETEEVELPIKGQMVRVTSGEWKHRKGRVIWVNEKEGYFCIEDKSISIGTDENGKNIHPTKVLKPSEVDYL